MTWQDKAVIGEPVLHCQGAGMRAVSLSLRLYLTMLR